MRLFVAWCVLLCGMRSVDCRKPWLGNKAGDIQSDYTHQVLYDSSVQDYQVNDQGGDKISEIAFSDYVDNVFTDSCATTDTDLCHVDIEGDNINKQKIFQYLEYYYDLFLKIRSWLLYFYELSTTYILAQLHYYLEVLAIYRTNCATYIKQQVKEFEWKVAIFKVYNLSLDVFQFCSATLVIMVTYFNKIDFQQVFDIINPDSNHWLVPVIKLACLICFVVTLLFSAHNDQNKKASIMNKKKEINNKPIPEGLDNHQTPLDGPKLVIFAGGSAMRELCKKITTNLSRNVTYVLPLSDDGGSSKEIIRVIGGPAIGDIRNRLNTLADDSTEENRAIKRLLDYRLSASDGLQARDEINAIIAGEHPLWTYYSIKNGKQNIKDAKKQPIISFLSHFYDAVSSEGGRNNHGNINYNLYAGVTTGFRLSTLIGFLNPISYNIPSDSNSNLFDFRGGSVGNFVLSGARLFMKSLDAAIIWYSEIISIPKRTQILPIITPSSLKERVQICALLSNGKFIYGQSEISHPHNDKNTTVAKQTAGNVKLQSPIKQIFYCDNGKPATVLPTINSMIIKSLDTSETIIYGMGSFYTSIIALLIVPGIGSTVKALRCPKVIVINGYPDRETFDMKLLDYIGSLIGAMKQSEGDTIPISSMFRYLSELGSNEINKYVTHVCYIDAPAVTTSIVPLDQLQILHTLGIKTIAIPPSAGSHQDFGIIKPGFENREEDVQFMHPDSLESNLESPPYGRSPSSKPTNYSIHESNSKHCSCPVYDNEKLLFEIKRIAENHKIAERKKQSFPEFDEEL